MAITHGMPMRHCGTHGTPTWDNMGHCGTLNTLHTAVVSVLSMIAARSLKIVCNSTGKIHKYRYTNTFTKVRIHKCLIIKSAFSQLHAAGSQASQLV